MKEHSTAYFARNLTMWAIRLMIMVGFTAGCVHRAMGRSTEVAPPVAQRDSLDYEQRLTTWLRDSAVVDSVARTINTDSLFRLTRALLHTTDAVAAQQKIECEKARIASQFGTVPAMRAINRMGDTSWSAAERVRVNALFAEGGMVFVNRKVCGPFGPSAPEKIGSTPLNTAYDRPIRPTRRKGLRWW